MSGRRRFLSGVKSGGGSVLPDILVDKELGQDGVDLFNYFFEKCGGDYGGKYVLTEPWEVTVYNGGENGYSQIVTITSVTSNSGSHPNDWSRNVYYLSFENSGNWGINLYDDGYLETYYD